jgi:hypothetical protein
VILDIRDADHVEVADLERPFSLLVEQPPTRRGAAPLEVPHPPR